MTFRIPKPTPELVSELHSKLVTEWSSRLVVEKEISDLIHQRNEIDTLQPNENRNMKPVVIHSGRAGGIIEHANGLIMAQPAFKAIPKEHTTAAKRDSDEVEAVCAKLFECQLLYNDFWPAVGRDVLSYGRAFLKAMPMPTAWTVQQGYPVRNKKETGRAYMDKVKKWKSEDAQFPFVIQHVPVQDILPLVDTDDNVLCSIEEKVVPAYILAEEMNSARVKEDLARGLIKWYDDLVCIEYTDPDHVAYYLTSLSPRTSSGEVVPLGQNYPATTYEELRVWTHGMGRCPVVMVTGIKTELPDKDGRYKSFLSDAKESLEAYDMLQSRLATMVWAYYLPSYIWKLGDSSAIMEGRDRPTLKVNLGGVTAEYADEDLRPLPPPEHLPDAVLLAQQTDDNIQRHTLEDVLFGRVQGSAPAFQVNLRINVARSKLTPIAQHMAQGITNVIDRFLRGVVYLGEDVTIDGETITPRQAKEYLGRVTASIEPKSPTDRAGDLGTANMALQFGLPWDWIAENILDIENPATLRLEKDIQLLEQTPEAQTRILQDALQELDLNIEKNDYEDILGMPADQFPPEMMAALGRIVGESGGQMPGQDEGTALGRGPYPAGGAPQTIQGGRGLLTPKQQPQPTEVGVPSNPGFGGGY